MVVLIASYHLELLVWSCAVPCWGGFLCTFLVIVYVYFFPTAFMPAFTEPDLWINIMAWSSGLILTGAVVGGTHRPFEERGSGAEGTQSEPAGEQGKD